MDHLKSVWLSFLEQRSEAQTFLENGQVGDGEEWNQGVKGKAAANLGKSIFAMFYGFVMAIERISCFDLFYHISGTHMFSLV